MLGVVTHRSSVVLGFVGFVLVHEDDGREYVCFGCFDNLTAHHHLVQDKVRTLQIEHYIELADVLEVFVESFDHHVNELQDRQLVLFAVDADDEEQRSIASVHTLVVAVLDERTLVFRTAEALANDFAFQGTTLLDRQPIVVLGKACLALFIDH